MRLRALAVFVLLAGASWAKPQTKPKLYRLWISTPDGKWDEQIADLFSRKLPTVEPMVIKHRERYKTAPELPVPVCEREEYYLFSPGEELLRIGCVNAASAATAIPEISAAITKYEAEVSASGNPTVLAPRRR